MPKSNFEGRFGIPQVPTPESELTSTLYMLSESFNFDELESVSREIINQVNRHLEEDDEEVLSDEAQLILQVKLGRYAQKHNLTELNIPTLVDALVETPDFLKETRGSIKKLYEIHEAKTLQKIAERRRLNSEKGEGVNPYEILYEIDEFYLARLFNMPHLEEESEYMKHCIANSDSYLNKIVRGEVEIFSLRSKGDHEPIYTLEYDRKTKSFRQIEGRKDERGRVVNLSSGNVSVLLEAILRLKSTMDESGQTRQLEDERIENLKKLQTIKFKHESGISLSASDLVILYEVEKTLQTFSQHDRVVIEDILRGRNVFADLDSILTQYEGNCARSPSEISEGCNLYAGKIVKENEDGDLLPEYEDIFGQLAKSDVRTLFVTSSDNDIEKKSVETIVIQDPRIVFALYRLNSIGVERGNVSEMLSDFTAETELIGAECSFVKLSVKNLGLGENASTAKIFSRAHELGLQLCPITPAVNYRLHYRHQPRMGQLYVAMEPLDGASRKDLIFLIDNFDVHGLHLGTHTGSSDFDSWGTETEFLFMLKK